MVCVNKQRPAGTVTDEERIADRLAYRIAHYEEKKAYNRTYRAKKKAEAAAASTITLSPPSEP
jgi:hypothetical protein